MKSMSCVSEESETRSGVSVPRAKTTDQKLQAEINAADMFIQSDPCMLVRGFAPKVQSQKHGD